MGFLQDLILLLSLLLLDRPLPSLLTRPVRKVSNSKYIIAVLYNGKERRVSKFVW